MSTGIASLNPADISQQYVNLQTDPITASDVQAEMSQMSMLFPAPRQQTIFDLALEQGGFMEGTSSLASALNYIVRAEKNPALKDTPEYALAIAVAKQPKVTLQQTETGTIPVEQPGIDVEGILSGYRKNQANTITDDNGVTWTPTGKTFQGKPVYSDGTNEAVF